MRHEHPTARHIAVSGLTAAGKTTHARLFAEAAGYQYVSASAIIMTEILQRTEDDSENVWARSGDALKADLNAPWVAKALTARLAALVADPQPKIFDTWVMPWLFPEHDIIRVWIESDRLSRAYKCKVSQGPGSSLSLVKCASIIDEKDAQVRDLFLAEYSIDIFNDRSRFDVVFDNTTTIDRPTRSSADRGIRQFAPLFNETLLTLVSRTPVNLPVRSKRPEFPLVSKPTPERPTTDAGMT